MFRGSAGGQRQNGLPSLPLNLPEGYCIGCVERPVLFDLEAIRDGRVVERGWQDSGVGSERNCVFMED
jgi:hypothetical protein